MADITLTVNSDKTISLSLNSLGSQMERVTIDVVVPAAVAALGYEAFLDFLLPDGTSCYKGGYDCSSELFSFGLGETDSVMDLDGLVYIQFWVGTIVATVKTMHWATEQKRTKINASVGATSAAVLPYVPQMVYPSTFPADLVTLTDSANRYTATNVEQGLAEIAGASRTTETVKANATSIGTLASLSTTTKTNLVVAINEVDGHADTANTSIGTLASLTTTEKTNLVGAINEVDKRFDDQTIVGYGALDNGKIKLDNGYMRIWGSFPCASLASDVGTGGYSTTIDLDDTFVGNPVGQASFFYASGGSAAYVHALSTTQIKVGSAVNTSGAFVTWSAEGLWK